MSKVTPIPEKPDMSHISEDRKKKWTQWVRRAYNHTGYIYTPCDGRAYLHHPGDGMTIKEAGELWASFVSEDGKPKPTAWHQYRSYGSPTEFRDFDENMSALEMWSEWVTRRAETSIPYFEYGLVYDLRAIGKEEAGRRWSNFTKDGVPGDDVYSLGEEKRGTCEYHIYDLSSLISSNLNFKSFGCQFNQAINGDSISNRSSGYDLYGHEMTIALPAFTDYEKNGDVRSMVMYDTWDGGSGYGNSDYTPDDISRRINKVVKSISTLDPEIARCEIINHTGSLDKFPEGVFWKGKVHEEGVWTPGGMMSAIEDFPERMQGRWLLIHLNGGSFEYK